jgi:ribosome-associated translation inhibitor RaiA
MHAVRIMPALNITFIGMPRSPSVETQIQRWVGKLEKSFERIQSCATWIEQPHRSARKGNTFRVRVELAVPGETLVVSRDSGTDHAHEDVYVAIADAFRAARRQLQDHARVRRGDVKLHA